MTIESRIAAVLDAADLVGPNRKIEATREGSQHIFAAITGLTPGWQYRQAGKPDGVAVWGMVDNGRTLYIIADAA